jgi:hypothetical protein
VSGATENRLKTQHVVEKAVFDCFLNKNNRAPKFMKKKSAPAIPAKAL